MPGAVAIEIKFSDTGVREILALASRRIDDLRPAFREMGERLVASTRHRFETHRAPNGSLWEPIKESTKQAKVRAGYSEKPLIRTGRMMNSIHPLVFSDRLEVGTNVKSGGGFPYPIVHQLGSVRVPKRPFLGVDQTDEKAIHDILERHIFG